MRIIKFLAILFLILAIGAAAVIFYIDRIAVAIIEKEYDLSIKYAECNKSLSGEFAFKDLSVVSKTTGMGIFSKAAKIKPSIKDEKVLLDFALMDGHFLMKSGNGPAQYDTLTALVSAPFNSAWSYQKISGQVVPSAKSVRVNGFEAVSSEIRLAVNGEMFNNGDIDAKVIIYFGSALTEKIPPEFAGMLLTGEKDGWKSLSVNLTGNPNKPSIQVASKSFRLSIKAVGL